IEAEAARNKYVLVPEPGRANNGVVTGRYAIARFNLEAIGKPSHAGATLASGRSAIREMARQIIAIDAMTTDDCTFSVGIVHGGQWVNCVATTCTGEALSMAKRQTDLDRGVERMLALSGTRKREHPFDTAIEIGLPLGHAERLAGAGGGDAVDPLAAVHDAHREGAIVRRHGVDGDDLACHLADRGTAGCERGAGMARLADGFEIEPGNGVSPGDHAVVRATRLRHQHIFVAGGLGLD